MDIEEYIREEPKTRVVLSPSSKAASKRKRNDDIMRNIPSGATSGFVSVKDLLVKGSSSKKRKKTLEVDPLTFEEDSDDRDIEAGIFAPRRTVSLSATGKEAKTKKPRRSKTAADDSTTSKASKTKRTKKKEPPPTKDLSASQVDKLESDSDDLEIEAGLLAPPKPIKKKAPSKKKTKPPPDAPSPSPPPRTPPRKKKTLPKPSSSPEIPLDDSVIDLTNTSFNPPGRSTPLFLSSSPDRPLSLEKRPSSDRKSVV